VAIYTNLGNQAVGPGPTQCPGCQGAPSPQNAQFDAGTFEFQSATAAPEPGSVVLFGCGLIALTAALRRKLTR
jgi:hypothetical protein